MLFIDMLGWWYSRGWAWAAKYFLLSRNKLILDFFSVGDMFKTLLAPFRQDAVSTKGAPIGVKLQALGGNLISRVFGLIIRSGLIMIGLICLVLNTAFAAICLVVWPLIPISPVIAIALIVMKVGVSDV